MEKKWRSFLLMLSLGSSFVFTATVYLLLLHEDTEAPMQLMSPIHANTDSTSCKNTKQGVLVTDDRGIMCEREYLGPTGCCLNSTHPSCHQQPTLDCHPK